METERNTQRENFLLGYSPQRSFENLSSSPKTPSRNLDFDFHDVFGGPPRRSSIHKMQQSAKPVFGAESVNRRRYPSEDFFDDIFRGDECHSSPRRSDGDPSSSTHGSRVLSPAPPLPPGADPFGDSFPAQFSLPAKQTKSMDFPGDLSLYKYKDGTSNGISYSYTPNASLSRFSSQAIQGQDELRNDVRSSYRQSPLSREFSLSCVESSYMTTSDETEIGTNLTEDLGSAEALTPSYGSQFHFSMYNWTGRGVPLLMPVGGRTSSISKNKGKIVRCLSFNGGTGNDSIVSELLTATVCDTVSLSIDHGMSANTESFKMEGEKKDKASSHSRVQTCQIVEEEGLKKPESNSLDTVQCNVGNVHGGTILSNKRDETKRYSLPEKGLSQETKEKISMFTQEARKPELKQLRSLLHDEIEEQGDEEITRKAEGKEKVVKKTLVSRSDAGTFKNVKKHDGKRINSNGAEVNEAIVQGAHINSGDNMGRSRVKGKVKEFVKIFDQETSSKPKINVFTRSQSSRWKGSVFCGVNYEKSVNTSGMDRKLHLPNLNKIADASFLVDESIEESKKRDSHIKTTIHKSSDNSSGQKDSSSFSESLPHASKVTFGNIDDNPFQEDFLIEELSHEQDKLPLTGEDYEAVQVLDAKIQQWSNGKNGNIRSLLSTLQYVLWPESGWKPVPLVDIIEGSAVKRVYQKGLLCLHPDKLQQKGIASHKKYIAEKVFEILQEAWEHFNSLASL